ncbi:phosphatase PAP2 family protein [Candidatus Woesearchaeota archaeon]|nr:phosphatase PAP2 family protein [Candidatus Woesearchaeota archaeon]
MKKKIQGLLLLLVSLVLITITFFLDQILMKAVPYLRLAFLNPVFAFLGASLGAIIYMLFLSTLFLYEKKTKIVPYLALAVISAFVISYLLKLIILRPRPEIIPLVIKSTSSFPSTHAAVAAATLFFIRKLKPTYFLALIPTILVILTGYYNGVHYLSDVLAGTLIGVVTSYFVSQRFIK